MELIQKALQELKKELLAERGDHLTSVFVTLESSVAHTLICDLNEITIYSRLKGIFGDKNKFVFKRGDR